MKLHFQVYLRLAVRKNPRYCKSNLRLPVPLYLGCNYITKAISNESNSASKNIQKFYKKHKNSKRKKRGQLTYINLVSAGKFKAIHLRPHIELYLGKLLKNCENSVLIPNLCFFENAFFKLYTDGSKMENSTSVGSSCISEDIRLIQTHSLHSHASIFTAEIMTINSALDFIARNKDTRHIIYSDSLRLSALQALQSYKTGSINHPLIIFQRLQKIV